MNSTDWDTFHSIMDTEFERRPVIEDISVLIPTLGRPILENCLYWILQGNTWPECLIIVEQGNNPDVVLWAERVRQLGILVTHKQSDQRGRSAGINRGLELVRTNFTAITDDDCFVAPCWLQNMASHLRNHSGEVITGRVEAAGEEMVVVVTSQTPSLQTRPRLKFDSMSGGNMGTALDVFRKVGLFEEDPVMKTAEDAEWAYRALRQGITIRYQPDVVVAHYGWRSKTSRIDQYRGYAFSHGGFYGKYLRKFDILILIRAFSHYLRALRRWAIGTVKGDQEIALLGKAYCQNLIPGIVAGIKSTMHPGKLS